MFKAFYFDKMITVTVYAVHKSEIWNQSDEFLIYYNGWKWIVADKFIPA